MSMSGSDCSFIVLFDVEIIGGGVMILFRSIDIRKLRISI